MDLSPFKDFIKGCCGLSFDETRAVTLETGIQERMSALGLISPVKYFKLLTLDHREFDHLVSLLTINETYFLREPGHFQLLSDSLAPRLLSSKKPNGKIRIMSAGCSTGEEPYSIVISLMEKYGNSFESLFSVIGIDIDNCAFDRARNAHYSGHSFRNFPDALKSKYFNAVAPNSFKIKDAVCNQVEFQLLNLLSDVYPESLKNLDVIFYRNVSIYFEPEVQKSIFSKLSDLLNDNGYLIVSSTETLPHNIGILSLIEIDNQFLYQKKPLSVDIGNRRKESAAKRASGASVRPNPSARIPAATAGTPYPARETPRLTSPAARTHVPERRESSELFDEALALAKGKHYHDAVTRLDALVEQSSAFIKAYTLKASVLINLKELDKAEQTCLSCIGLDPWCLEALLLLGMIAKIRSDDETAFKRFKEALYINSSCWLAHFYIAEIDRLRGELNSARREYEIVINLLKKGNIEDHGLTFFPLSFPIEQIVHLCNHNLTQLKRKLK